MSNQFLYVNLTHNKFMKIRKLRIFIPQEKEIVQFSHFPRNYSDKSNVLSNKNDSGIIVPKFLKLNLLHKEKNVTQKFFDKFSVQTSRKFITDEIFSRRLTKNLLNYIEEISHMDEVREAQKNVMDIKDKLKQSGDHKRDILFALNTIRFDIQKNHTEICNAIRGTERYVALIKDEMTLLNDEKQKQFEFNKADDLERQLFNQLTAAINDSYEKEKIHSNFIKVLGVIGALIGSILTLIASAVGHFYHNTKFGILANDFKENVSKTIHIELSSLKDTIRLDLAAGMKKQEELLRKLEKSIIEKNKTESSESWGGYIHRYSVNVYRFFIPKRTTTQ